jgi:type I restriction enzyme, S subunit
MSTVASANWQIPTGWAWCTFSDIAEIAQDLVDPAEVPNAPHIAPNHIESGTRRLLPYTTVREDGVTSPKQRFTKGQILFTKIRPYLLKSVLADFDGVCSADMYPLWTKQTADSKYVLYWVTSPDFREIIAFHQGRTVLPKINQPSLNATPVPLPPLDEQHRIVAKIDSLSGKSKRARDHLDHLPRLVEKYKQSILSAAFRGELTKEWRKRNVSGISVRDLEIRRHAAWQAAKAEGAAGGRYQDAAAIDWRPDLDIPTGWVWASVDQLVFLVQYGSSAKTSDYAQGCVPVLRMGNIQAGQLDWTNLKYLPEEHAEFPGLLLETGDILFNRTNSAELVGKTAVYLRETGKASFASYLIRLRASGIHPALLSAYINSPFGRSWVASVVNQQVGQANVNGTKLRQLGVPVMPEVEQAEIARCIETAFAWIDRLAAEATSARKLINHLDQAILSKAFRGELVPQDPNDEPASVLLERIRAEQAPASRNRRTRSRTSES